MMVWIKMKPLSQRLTCSNDVTGKRPSERDVSRVREEIPAEWDTAQTPRGERKEEGMAEDASEWEKKK